MNSSTLSSMDMMGPLESTNPLVTSTSMNPSQHPDTRSSSELNALRENIGTGGASPAMSTGASQGYHPTNALQSAANAYNELNTCNKSSEKKLFKLLVVGDYAVGKTSLIRRYCTSEFTNNYRITIGVDFCLKSLVRNNEEIDLQLWDIAGHERFGNMTRVFYRLSIAAIVCFDISRPSTFDNVKKWRDDINEKVELPNGKPIPMILLANKCDLPDLIIDKEKMSKFAKDNGFLSWFETSAKENTNIDKSIDFLVDEILKISKTLEIQSPARGIKNENNFSLVDDIHGERRLDDNVSTYSQSNDSRSGSRRVDTTNRIARCCNTG